MRREPHSLQIETLQFWTQLACFQSKSFMKILELYTSPCYKHRQKAPIFISFTFDSLHLRTLLMGARDWPWSNIDPRPAHTGHHHSSGSRASDTYSTLALLVSCLGLYQTSLELAHQEDQLPDAWPCNSGAKVQSSGTTERHKALQPQNLRHFTLCPRAMTMKSWGPL